MRSGFRAGAEIVRLGGQDADESSVAGIDHPSEAQVEVVWKIHSLMWNFHNLPFGTLNCTAVVSTNHRCGPNPSFGVSYEQSKPATTSKHARSPKIAAKAQRTTQAIVRSPKVRRSSVAAGSAKSSPRRHNDSKSVAALVIPAAPLVIENPVVALQDDFKKTMTVNRMTVNSLSKGFDLSSATADVRAYQAKLLEMAQVNMTFAFEFSERLVTTRSPLEFVNAIAEFTSKRIAMFGKYSKELAELSAKRSA